MRIYQVAIGISLCLFLAGCGGGTRAPVSDRSLTTSSAPSPDSYIVRKGDTLYAIAFRYGLDYRKLAQLNGIDRDFSIYPGQRIRLKAATTVRSNRSIVSDRSISAPKVQIVRKADPAAATSKPANSPIPKAKTQVSTPAVKQTKPQSKPASKPLPAKPSGPIIWVWPSNGKVISYFKTKGSVNKGINFSGSKGDPVKAAAAGRVVYAGNGLLGYGNLVIVEHNSQFLSAYAHNSRVLVKENDMVKAGQKIAEMGSTGADRVMLHFEIRRDGKPLNPLRYLPKR